MKRRTFNLLAGSAIATSHPAYKILSAMIPATSFKMQHLRNNVGYFSERGGTIGWMMNEEGVVVIDTQFPEQAGHLIGEIRKESQLPVKYLINTHHHGDHTAGNIAFKGIAEKIVAHRNSRKNQEASAGGDLDKVLLPDTVFDMDWEAKIGDEHIVINYMGRAHTDGDTITHFTQANVVHLGDLVFNRRFPYIDKGAGASIENWINVLDKVKRTYADDSIFICGHAGEGYDILVDKDDIAAFAHYLEKVLQYVGGAMKSGKSDDEILSATEIPGAPEWQGGGIERSLNAALIELRENK